MIKNNKVAVTGMGIVSPIGFCVPEFAQSLKQGTSGIKAYPESKGTYSKIGAKIEGFSAGKALKNYPDEYVKKAMKCIRRSDNATQSCVAAAMEAVFQAGANFDGETGGIVVAGSNLSCAAQYNTYLKKELEFTSPRYALEFMDTNHVGILSEIFEIHGEGFSVGNASASGNAAIIKAMQMIRYGIVDYCLVAGPYTALSPAEFQGFYNLGALGGKRFSNEPEKACRPFDAAHEGFIYGQASACMLLESEQMAKKHGTEILSFIAGGAILLHGSQLSEPNGAYELAVMQRALNDAGTDINSVDYINAHATSTPLGDETELEAIEKIAGERTSEIWVNSTKSLTGHCLSSAGLVEAIAAIVQMRGAFVHPNLNLDNPTHPMIRFCGSKENSARINTAVSNSFGFGGINTSIVLKRGV